MHVLKRKRGKKTAQERQKGRGVIRSQPVHPSRQLSPGQDLPAQKNYWSLVGNFYLPVMRFLVVYLMDLNSDPVLNRGYYKTDIQGLVHPK